MPNWCENRWDIFCDSEDEAEEVFNVLTRKTVEKADHREVTFSILAPRPEILDRLTVGGATIDGESVETWIVDTVNDKPIKRRLSPAEQAEVDATGFTSWYDWSLANWGTKWDAVTTNEPEFDGSTITLKFMTAWSPPEAFYFKVLERFPKISISAFYDEPANRFAGYLE